MRSRPRGQEGFALPELLTALSMAVIVAMATFALIEFVMKRTGEVQGRTEASQRGRAAMDTMTRQLRSQVCMSSTVPPMAEAQATSATFYVDFTDQSNSAAPPEKHQLLYDATTRQLVEKDYVGTSDGLSPPTFTYPAMSAPTRTRVLMDSVIPDRPAGAPQDTPIFRYLAFDAADPPRPELELTPPMLAGNTDLGRIARIVITFRSLPPGQTAKTRNSIVLQDEVYVRAADPNDPAPTPTCA